ncbi:hypothetical protein [Flavobacterium geliluteum]|uniref:Uncharacterized protein n=1 Tax=Flavobacterium geliluteum TaxID=2816120 RepID=A0A941AWV9_9FLAO|nr:hypothetical protein [Flavobacterium geliluteum]MBP4137171.1 hypothetical protein [Flavobacterium geliluteum]
MKTLKLTIFGIFLLVANATQAQVSVNINIGSPPEWGPVGYTEMEYYYLPDIEAYYDVRATQFIYFGGGKWIRSSRLPRQYRNYDLYGGYKVVLNDYHGRRPYTYFKNHRVKYYKGYHGAPQKCYKPRKGNGHYKHERNDRRDDRRNDRHDDRHDRGHGKHHRD